MAKEVDRRTYLKGMSGAAVGGLTAGCNDQQRQTGNGTKTEQSENVTNNAEPITLKVSTWIPEGHYVNVAAIEPWMKRVEYLTDGKVTFDYLAGGQLGSIGDQLRLVKQQTTDIAQLGSQFFPKLQLGGVAAGPGAWDDMHRGNLAAWLLRTPGYEHKAGVLHKEEWQKQNIRSLGIGGFTPPNQFITKEEPIKSMSDVKGLTVGIGGGGFSQWAVEELGASPVTISAKENYSALKSGTVDAITTPIPSMMAYDVHKVANHATTNLHIGTFDMTWGINEDTWSSLPAEYKHAFNLAARWVLSKNELVVATRTEQKMESVKSEMNFYEVSGDTKSKMGQAFDQVMQDWVGRMKDEGKPAQKALDAYNNHLKTVAGL